MQTSTVITVVATSIAGGILTACGTQAAEPTAPPAPDIVEQAETYVGDPWEKRFRQQFWANQHIHDSWNRCHLGENALRPRGC